MRAFSAKTITDYSSRNHETEKYAIVDLWFWALPVSRQLGPVPEISTGVDLFELDLKAGLRDSNPERCPGEH
jgi:hypothetical protein